MSLSVKSQEVSSKKRYVIWYIGIIVFALLGLMLNIKTVAMNLANQKIKRELNQLNDENQLLEIKVLQETSYARLETQSRELGMEPVKQIVYVPIKKP